MKLYGYFRSSAAYRVRIALNLKGLDHKHVHVHLHRHGGEHLQENYAAVNPQLLVPTLAVANGRGGEVALIQSLAILEYLDEVAPEPPILPPDPLGRARVRGLAEAVACEIHPLQNLRVLNYLTGPLGVDEADKTEWAKHWITAGFAAIEALLAEAPETGRFCHGEAPGLADICLVPQVYNARRFGLDLAPYPTIRRIEAACLDLPAFDAARPENRLDAE
jgi:maleylacetoacetate isomerase